MNVLSDAARKGPYPWLCLVLALAVVAGLVWSGSETTATARPHPPRAWAAAERAVPAPVDGEHWVAAWTASPQPATRAVGGSIGGFRHATLREVVFSSVGGTEVRVRFTNAFGARPLMIARAAVAVPSGGASLAAGSSRQLLFGGSPSVTVPAGAEVLSDPVALNVRALGRLAISLYLPGPTGRTTVHGQSHQWGFVAHGSHILDMGSGPFHRRINSWYLLDAVDVLVPSRVLGTIVALGDSITAGVNSSQDHAAAWPNDLARRLNALPGPTLAAVDAGIGGNRVLNSSPCCGPNALARLGPDVLDQTGVREVVLLEGVNDIGYSQSHTALTAPHTNVSAAQIIAGEQQLIARAHAAGLAVFGATITPFRGARYWTAAGEAKRDAVNHWIMTGGAFDGVIDFASALADPANPQRLRRAYDSGDHLHPNDAGYRAMAAAVDLALLVDHAA
jgi:lysophospholipase L1-like esterase